MDQRSPYIIIITGNPGSGKTSFVNNLVESFIIKGITITGFLAPASSANLKNKFYEIQNIETGERLPLASRKKTIGWIKVGNFFFNPDAVQAGKKILNNPGLNKYDMIVVDEVGPFELDGKIWADSLTSLLSKAECHMVWVVRKNIIKEVIQKWDLKETILIDIEKFEVHEAKKVIISKLKPG